MSVSLVRKQRGMTMISWLVVLAFLGFQGMVAMKVAPVYFSDASIKSVLKGMEKDTELVGKSPKTLRDTLFKRLKINNIYALTKDNIKLKKTRSYYLMIIEYEPRGNIAGTLDFIITFKHKAKIPFRPG
jgi:hypothetical protein